MHIRFVIDALSLYIIVLVLPQRMMGKVDWLHRSVSVAQAKRIVFYGNNLLMTSFLINTTQNESQGSKKARSPTSFKATLNAMLISVRMLP